MRITNLLTLSLCALLSGCAASGAMTRPTPTIVYVPVTNYVPIREDLTKPCPIAAPLNTTAFEARHVAKLRGLALEDCNIDKATIQKIQGTPVPTIK